MIAELPPVWRRCLKEPGAAATASPPEGDEGRLLSLLSAEPTHIERLIERSNLPSGRAAALLMTLELHGWVRQLPGQMYVQTRPM